jgi:hypothetical protein
VRVRFNRAGAAALAIGASMAAGAPAFATLGSTPLSGVDSHVVSVVSIAHVAHVANAAATTSATTSGSTTSTTYTTNTITLQSGTVVREYVNTSTNQVFGLAWQGPRVPDLRQLLGTSFVRFAGSASQQPESTATGTSHRALVASDLVVQSGGHMGLFVGKAYLPERLPSGVSASDIQ